MFIKVKCYSCGNIMDLSYDDFKKGYSYIRYINKNYIIFITDVLTHRMKFTDYNSPNYTEHWEDVKFFKFGTTDGRIYCCSATEFEKFINIEDNEKGGI